MSAPDPSTDPALDLVCLGEAMVEFNRSRDDASLWRSGFGGDTSNCAIAAARFGARSGYITQLGDDVFGERLLQLWRDEHVDSAGVRVVSGGATGVYFVTHGAEGHQFTYRRAGSAASRMAADDAGFAPDTTAILVRLALLRPSRASTAPRGRSGAPHTSAR